MTSRPRFIPAAELSRRLGIAPRTLSRRLAEAGIQPDGHLVAGACRDPLALYLEGRLPELKAVVLRAPCPRTPTDLDAVDLDALVAAIPDPEL